MYQRRCLTIEKKDDDAFFSCFRSLMSTQEIPCLDFARTPSSHVAFLYCLFQSNTRIENSLSPRKDDDSWFVVLLQNLRKKSNKFSCSLAQRVYLSFILSTYMYLSSSHQVESIKHCACSGGQMTKFLAPLTDSDRHFLGVPFSKHMKRGEELSEGSVAWATSRRHFSEE